MSRPTQKYGAVNLANGLGSLSSKSSQWVPEQANSSISRLRTFGNLYDTTIAHHVINIPIDGVLSGQIIGQYDDRIYTRASQLLQQCLQQAGIYGCAWITENLQVQSIVNRVPDESALLHAHGPRQAGMATNLWYRMYLSELARCHSDIILYEACKTAIAESVSEFALLTLEVEDLADQQADPQFITSMQSLAYVKTATGIIPIPLGSKMELLQRDYIKVAPLLEIAGQAIAASSGIPRAILLRQSPEGSTSGRFETLQFFQLIEQRSRQWINLINILLKIMGGGYVESIDHSAMLSLYLGGSVSGS
jgi:hypothetical protein